MYEVTKEDKLFNFRPALFTGAFLALGIAFYYLHQVYGVSVWWSALLLLTATPLCFCCDKKRAKKLLFGALCMIAVFLVGFFAFSISVRSYTQAVRANERCTVQGRVVDFAENGDEFYVVLDKISINGAPQKGRLIAYVGTSYAKNFTLAHTLKLDGKLRTLSDEGLEEYAHRIVDDIRYTLSAQSYNVGERPFSLFLWARARLRNVLYTGMDKESASVTTAILTGDTAGIGEGLLQNVRYGGIAHIFAVSGLHVGALFAVCLTLFKGRLQALPRYVRFLSVAVVLLLYGGVCGYSASILRATVMCLCSYLCRLWFFGSDGLERIGFAGIVVLLISPATLFDIGFQLSFSACLGIVVLYRPISRLCYGLADKIVPPAEDAKDKPRSIPRRIFRFFVGLFTTTVSAQIATAPLLLNTFGFLSGWSLLLNMLFVPIVSALFSLALCVAFVACLLPLSVAPVLLYAPSVVWSALLLLFHVVDFSTFALTSDGISLFSRVLYAVACSFLTDKWNLTKGLKILLFCLFLFCFVFSCFFL